MNKRIALLMVVLIGLVVPFIPVFTVIEMVILVAPFLIAFIVTLVWVIACFITKDSRKLHALFIFSIIPIFVISQLASGFIVDKIQRLRSNHIINEIEKIASETGKLPEKYELGCGIKYTKISDSEHFTIEYSRGFMVVEKFDSTEKKWKSYGWNG